MTADKSYLSAPFRKRPSATAKKVLTMVSGQDTILDYGCGRGKDVEYFKANGFNCWGYDPHYFPSDTVKPADFVIVNYVLNVLPTTEARREVLLKAWCLTLKSLVISTNVSGKFCPDGRETSIGTFVKTFTFVEFKAFVESTLEVESTKLDGSTLMVSRQGRQLNCLSRDEVINKIKDIEAGGYVAPPSAKIKGYCSDFKFRPKEGIDYRDSGEFPGRIRYQRMIADSRILPSKTSDRLVKCRHISNQNTEDLNWCTSAIARRNEILRLKFHCKTQDFLEEFKGCKNFDFLLDDVKIFR